jgi:hypothetical protein
MAQALTAGSTPRTGYAGGRLSGTVRKHFRKRTASYLNSAAVGYNMAVEKQ